MNELPTHTNMTVLHFLLQNVHACIELNFIKRVLPLPFIETIPGSPAYLVGIMNLAGHSIPVIDLCLRLGMQRQRPYTLNIPILLCFDGLKQVGVVVDEIMGLVDVEKSTLQMRDDFEKHNSPFLAIISVHNTLSLLLNIKRLINISLTMEEVELFVDQKLLNQAKK